MYEKSKNISSGIFFFAAGIAICLGAWKLRLGAPLRPRAGLMPFLTGTVISGLSLILIYSALKPTVMPEVRKSIKGEFKNIGLTVLAMVACIGLMNFLGFTVAIGLFLFFMFRFIEPIKLSTSILISVFTSAGIYTCFGVLLKVTFPKGVFGF
jgi:hypothetical protein